MNSIDKQSEENTTEFTATIKKVETIDTGKKIYIEIYIKEQNNTLTISNRISKMIHMDDINGLKEGQTIFFRVENDMLEQFKETGSGYIVSLKTSEKEIFSLESYNKYIHESAFQARIACIVLVLLFFKAFTYCVSLLLKKEIE